jgi:hypothetical protein
LYDLYLMSSLADVAGKKRHDFSTIVNTLEGSDLEIFR